MIGVVADDITGANDIGIMFAKNNYRTVVIGLDAIESNYTADVIVIDTNSRLSNPDVAYERTQKATRRLVQFGCKMFFAKVCSVFRGNIGRTFDAMLDELNEPFAPVILGFPKNGRTTVNGLHYVRGVELKESEFFNDPVHPMKESNLQSILQKQTNRRVATVNWKVVAAGSKVIKDELEELRGTTNYVIFDVRNQEDLRNIAETVKYYKVLCGSSAIAEELPQFLKKKPKPPQRDFTGVSSAPGVLLVAGSLMPQTKRQIEYLRVLGADCLELDTVKMFQDSDSWGAEADMLVKHAIQKLHQDSNVMVYSSNLEESVHRTIQLGLEQGLSEFEASKRVSKSLADITSRIVMESGCRRVIVGGGETSGAVCDELRISSIEVVSEIAPGLPLSVSLNYSTMALILKSGSFGTDDFFARAIEKIRGFGWENSHD